MEPVDERVPTVVKSKAEVESDSKVFKGDVVLVWIKIKLNLFTQKNTERWLYVDKTKR